MKVCEMYPCRPSQPAWSYTGGKGQLVDFPTVFPAVLRNFFLICNCDAGRHSAASNKNIIFIYLILNFK